jgi:hypothetical protein
MPSATRDLVLPTTNRSRGDHHDDLRGRLGPVSRIA